MPSSLDELLLDPTSLIDAECECCSAKLPAASLFPISGNSLQYTIEDDDCAWERFMTRDGWTVGDEKSLIAVCPTCDAHQRAGTTAIASDGIKRVSLGG